MPFTVFFVPLGIATCLTSLFRENFKQLPAWFLYFCFSRSYLLDDKNEIRVISSRVHLWLDQKLDYLTNEPSQQIRRRATTPINQGSVLKIKYLFNFFLFIQYTYCNTFKTYVTETDSAFQEQVFLSVGEKSYYSNTQNSDLKHWI